jgi:hypothetical protein
MLRLGDVFVVSKCKCSRVNVAMFNALTVYEYDEVEMWEVGL